MPSEVQLFSCPKCRRGEFRSLPSANGKAFCPWCGDAVPPMAAPVESPADAVPLPEFSLEELASRISSGDTAVRVAPAPPTPPPASPPAPAPTAPGLDAKLAESEKKREAVEAELRKELEKKQGIKKAVMSEMGRIEADLAEARDRIRRKDEEHAAALQTLNLLKDAKEQEWNGDRLRYQAAVDEKEKALKAAEARLEERQKAASELQGVLDKSRAEVGKLHADVAAAQAERDELKKKLGAADAKLKSLKDAPARIHALEKLLETAQTKATSLQTEVEKKDQRLKELGMLVKTLGERLNDLADRAPARGPQSS